MFNLVFRRRMIEVKLNEFDYYNKLANWSFDNINYTEEILTNWIYEEEIK